jgi:hypothetical protein
MIQPPVRGLGPASLSDFHSLELTTMTITETRKALKLLGDKIERSETMAIDAGGYCLSVVFVGGWSRIFYTLEMVREWCLDHADF